MTFVDNNAIASKALETSSRFLPVYIITSMFKRNNLEVGISAIENGLIKLAAPYCKQRLIFLNKNYSKSMVVFVFSDSKASKSFDKAIVDSPESNFSTYCCSPLIKETMEMTDFRIEGSRDNMALKQDNVLMIYAYIKFGFYQKSLKQAQTFVNELFVRQFNLNFYQVFLQYETGRVVLVVAFNAAQDLDNYTKSGAILQFTDAIKDHIRSVPTFETWQLISRKDF